jgi:hypothetical protein
LKEGSSLPRRQSMKFIYILQFVFLTIAFVHGYRLALSPFRIVMIALINELIYCGVVFALYFYGPEIVMWLNAVLEWAFEKHDPIVGDLIDVFDLYRLEKELWLYSIIRWLGGYTGHTLRLLVADLDFVLLSFMGGFFVTLITVVGGSIFRNAVYAMRMDAAKQ